VHSDSKHKSDHSQSSLLQQMEGKLTLRIKDLTDQHHLTNGESAVKIKQLEREKAQLSERLELASRDQQSEFGNLQKKHEKQTD